MTSVRMTQVFFHGPRALFNMNDDFGGDTVIRSNLFFKSLLGAALPPQHGLPSQKKGPNHLGMWYNMLPEDQTALITSDCVAAETSDHGPYNSWDRLPYLTDVLNGTNTIDSAYNHLTANMFFSGSPYAIDTDDGSDRVNCTSNVIVSTPLFKTDFAGHQKTFQNNVDLYGACGGSEAGTGDRTNVFTGQKCVGVGSPLVDKEGGGCAPCETPGVDCPTISGNEYYTAAVAVARLSFC